MIFRWATGTNLDAHNRVAEIDPRFECARLNNAAAHH
jgi:hypothetical protein